MKREQGLCDFVAAVAFGVVIASLLMLLMGCEVRIEDTPCDQQQTCPDGRCPDKYNPGPVNRLEKALQTENYAGGSCAHAATIDSLMAQGRADLAARWRASYSGGASLGTLRSAADRLNVDYAYTSSGDMGFLDWCSRTRRPACIFYYTRHAITFVGFEGGMAILLDNNKPGKEIRVGRAEFKREWDAYGRSYGHTGGVAFAAVYSPAPPPPTSISY